MISGVSSDLFNLSSFKELLPDSVHIKVVTAGLVILGTTAYGIHRCLKSRQKEIGAFNFPELPQDVRNQIYLILKSPEVMNLGKTCKIYHARAQEKDFQQGLLAPKILLEELSKMDLSPDAIPKEFHYQMGMALADISPRLALNFVKSLFDNERHQLCQKIVFKLLTENTIESKILIESILEEMLFRDFSYCAVIDKDFKFLEKLHSRNVCLSEGKSILEFVRDLTKRFEKEHKERCAFAHLTLGLFSFLDGKRDVFEPFIERLSQSSGIVEPDVVKSMVIGLNDFEQGMEVWLSECEYPSEEKERDVLEFYFAQSTFRKKVFGSFPTDLLDEVKNKMDEYIASPQMDFQSKMLAVIFPLEHWWEEKYILKVLGFEFPLDLKNLFSGQSQSSILTALRDQISLPIDEIMVGSFLSNLLNIGSSKPILENPIDYFQSHDPTEFDLESAAYICETAKSDFFDPIAMLKKFKVEPKQERSFNPFGKKESKKPEAGISALFYIKALQHSPYRRVQAEAKAFFESLVDDTALGLISL
ncbi:MAG: hypothetical protein K1000chlam2_00465 [Chlamydiae bacterium]|nr:hypothetical protein [Chlamydiota bacterium]